MPCQNPQLCAFILLFMTGTEIKTLLPKPTFQPHRPKDLHTAAQSADAKSPPSTACRQLLPHCLPETPHDIWEDIPTENGLRQQQPSFHNSSFLQRKATWSLRAQVGTQRFDTQPARDKPGELVESVCGACFNFSRSTLTNRKNFKRKSSN